MIGARITYSIRQPGQKCIQSYYGKQLCQIPVKECCLRAASLHCTLRRDEDRLLESYHPLKSKLTDYQLRRTNHSDTFSSSHSLEPVQEHSNTYLNNELEQKNSDMQKRDALNRRRLELLFSNPVSQMNNVYIIVSNELGIEDPVIAHSEVKSVQNSKVWQHTFNVSWPSPMTFVGVGSNKSLAAKAAALKCLGWLHDNGRLRNNKPVLYTQHEARKFLFRPVEVTLEPEFRDEVKAVTNMFHTDIKDLMAPNSRSDIHHMLSLTKELYSQTSNNIITTPAAVKQACDETLKSNLSSRSKSNTSLPIYKFREKIIKTIEDNQIVLIKGDTGCGKTTQVPQFIMDSYTQQNMASECNMIISQPRRISAISLAEQVARERNEKLGNVVGYQVRLEQVIPKSPASILFCTTGIVLRKMQSNPNLHGISHIILDEAHERSVDIDMLMVLLKKSLENNPSLKLVVMSATINADMFQRYFECPVIDVPGRMYPVQMHFKQEIDSLLSSQYHSRTNANSAMPEVDFYKVANLIKWISLNKTPGAILCFLPGWSEITLVQHLLTNVLNKNMNQRWEIVLLHSKLSPAMQRKIFEPVPAGTWKIILSTDIAETGITVSDVSYVVDTALKKDMRWDMDKELPCMENHWISQANIAQRKGRAGRVKPGESYHLISSTDYQNLEPYPLPEVLRTSLEQAVLVSKTYSNQTAQEFFMNMPEPPTKSAIDQAVQNLIGLGIIDPVENLTALGRRVSYLSIHPKLGKAVVYSSIFRCLDPVITIASAFSQDDNIFVNKLSDTQIIRATKTSYHNGSDHIAIASLFNEWKSRMVHPFRSEVKDFCQEVNVHFSRLVGLEKIRQSHLLELTQSRTIVHPKSHSYEFENTYANNEGMIPAVLFAATGHLLKHQDFGVKNGYLTKTANGFQAEDARKTAITQDSVNYKRKHWPSLFLTYLRRTHSDKRRHSVVRDTSLISPLTVFLFSSGDIEYYNDSNYADDMKLYFTIENYKTARLCCNKESMELLKELRSILWTVADYILLQKGVPDTENLSRVLNYQETLLNVISRMLNVPSKDLDSDK